MRATAPRLPVHASKHRLLEGCAIAAAMAALAHGSPALAQVAGTGEFAIGTGTISPPGPLGPGAPPNSTQVTVNGAQTVINWTPDDTAPSGGPIDFLPETSNLEFYGTGDYTVLNRFIGPAAAARPVALNGTVSSYVGSPFATGGNVQGGNIWFYNAGGLLIGATAVINVGSLVLTTNDIDTTGGLYGAGGEIRFRGAASGAANAPAIEIAPGASAANGINAALPGNPGGSYIAMVAPRIVQRGTVTVDGSTAYVAAEQADIRINGGLFDINVLVGAAGGEAIVHSGSTGGPAHVQDDTDRNRIYMVAVPKNDAVSMLVSGQIGYDAAVAQIDPNGAVVLSAGYDIVGGEIAAAPSGGTAADITINDALFRSSTTAHASGAFLGQSQSGPLRVEGDASFFGDISATVNVGAGQIVQTTGNLTVQATGAAGAPGIAAVNIAGGSLFAGGDVSIVAGAALDTATGIATGGSASLSIIDGGGVTQIQSLLVSADATGDIGSAGTGGAGTGGSASIDVIGAGSVLQADAVAVRANGTGGGATAAVDQGGAGTGGTAAISVQDGAALDANQSVDIEAIGTGETGNVASGGGSGGAASLAISGNASSYATGTTTIDADGTGGGGDGSGGTPATAQGGAGTGGTAELQVDADQTSTILPGFLTLSAAGNGGNAGGVENARGGDAAGGTVTVGIDGGATVETDQLTASAGTIGGGAVSPSLTSGRAGDARGGAIVIDVAGGSLLQIESIANLFAYAIPVVGEITGSGSGGDIGVTATDGGQVTTLGQLSADVSGGSLSSGGGDPSRESGDGTGGNVDVVADGGTILAGSYSVFADGTATDAAGAGGTAQGGTVDLLASDGGLIQATDTAGSSLFSASARSGFSAGGTGATGGTVRLIADAGTIDLAAMTELAADGTSGGDADFGGTAVPLGRGGTILVRTVADPANSSVIRFETLIAGADGRSAVSFDAPPGSGGGVGAGNGRGGTATLDIRGGTFTAARVDLDANGTGGGVGPDSGTGTGGTATFAQSSGAADITLLTVSANGEGGEADDVSGTGVGGTATIDLNGGTLTGIAVTASATGTGGPGMTGDDFDPDNPIPPGAGGDGVGGTATINLDGTAAVTVESLTADATGQGADGGDLSSFGTFAADGGAGGEGSGGQAAIHIVSGTLDTGDLSATAAGIGGNGGTYSNSSGAATGISVGGDGGVGTGGTATIDFATGIAATGTVSASATGTGGLGGGGDVGGNGGNAGGGVAEVLATGADAEIAIETGIDSTATGGDAGFGTSGDRGDGGNAVGGTSRVRASGAGTSVTVSQTNFVTDGLGGEGANGGDGTGGTLEIAAAGGGAVTLVAVDFVDPVSFGSTGSGGMGNDSGGGGNGTGGTVHLIADGGTIGSDGHPVEIVVDGVAGGGAAPGETTGGRAIVETAGDGALSFGDTVIRANGDNAGRVELRSGGDLTFASLDAQALGAADPANGDVAAAASGIFLNAAGGSIATGGAMTLTTDGSVGVHGQGAGSVGAGTDLTIGAGDRIDIRHAARSGAAPTLHADGALSATAANGISGGAGSLIDAGGTLSLTATAGGIGVDRLHGANIFLDSSGAATVEHAEADDDFTATVGSFATGLNSIITGGDIDIDAPGTVDLGNSTAGGFVSVVGQTIDFHAIDAGTTVSLRANGFGATDGIAGTDITAGGAVALNGGGIAVTGRIAATGSVSITANRGNASVGLVEADGDIGVSAGADLSGTYRAGGNIRLGADGDIAAEADAAGGYVDPTGSFTSEGYVFADADGDATLTNSSAATMFAVRSGGAAAVTGSSAGEDMFVLAGTTAALSGVTAGDDLTVGATGAMIVADAATTGTGSDGRSLVYAACCSNPIPFLQIVTSTPDLSNVTLSSPGTIAASDIAAFDNLTIAAGGAVTGTGLLQSGLATGVSGSNLSLGAITAGTDIDLTATTGAIGATGAIAAGHDATLDAATDIAVAGLGAGDDLHLGAAGTLSAGAATSSGTGLDDDGDGSNIVATAGGAVVFAGPIASANDTAIEGSSVSTQAIAAGRALTLTATAGDIAAGDASATDRATLTASGGIATGDLTLGNFGEATAGGAVTLGDVETFLGLRAEGASVAVGNLEATGGDLALVATGGGITATGTIDAAGSLFADATGAANLTGDIRTGGIVRIFAGSVSVGTVTAGGSVLQLVSSSGPIVATGTLTSGRDILIGTAAGGTLGRLVASDDIAIGGSGDVTVTSMRASGENPGDEEVGSNVGVTLDGTLAVGQVEAADDFTAEVASFSTDGGTLTAGGNIQITADGAADLGTANAGDRLETAAQSIAFAALDAGAGVGLEAGGAIGGTSIAAGGPIALTGNSVAVDSIAGDMSLTATATGGGAAIGTARLDGNIDVTATGDIGGAFDAGGDITLTSDADVSASTNARGGYLDSGSLTPAAGDIRIAAAGSAALTDSAAAGVLDVDAGGSASLTNVGAGGDTLLHAGTTATLSGVTAGNDLRASATGALAATGPVAAGRDIAFDTGSADLTALTAGRNVTVAADGDIDGSTITADGDIALTAGGTIAIAQATKQGDGLLSLTGADGVSADTLISQGRTSLASSGGAIVIDNLASQGAIDAAGDSIAIGGSGTVHFAALTTDVGDAVLDVSGELTVTQADVAGFADFTGAGERLAIDDLTAADARLTTTGFMTLGSVAATDSLDASAAGAIFIDGAVTGTAISLASNDIAIGPDARVGTAGATRTLAVRNNADDRTTYIGGTGDRDGYHLDADEMARLFGDQVTVVAPQRASDDGAFVASAPGALFVPIASVGSSAAPDVVVDAFTMTGGGPGSNLGATGSLTIETSGKMRVVGAAALTGLGDGNALTLAAGDALEVVLGEGSVRLTGDTDAPAGQLNLRSDDVIVATLDAIADVAAAGGIDAIESRLARNDGIVSDAGALYAGGIDATVVGGFYVQNSGAGTAYGQRRGLSFGAGGLDVTTEGPTTRIVLNGVHLGPNGQVTGLDTIPLLRVNGAAPTASGLDMRSTFNGCAILNTGPCSFIANPKIAFPVQDVIEEETDPDGDRGDGIALPTALITMRGIDPMTGEPLLDDPVTGAGNDDLWTPPGE